MCYYRRPDLFHVHHNIERLDGPFDEGGDVCHMLWPGWPAQVRKTQTHNPPLFYLRSSASDAPAPPHRSPLQEKTELFTEKAMREEGTEDDE